MRSLVELVLPVDDSDADNGSERVAHMTEPLTINVAAVLPSGAF